jgi:hypothetical protein
MIRNKSKNKIIYFQKQSARRWYAPSQKADDFCQPLSPWLLTLNYEGNFFFLRAVSKLEFLDYCILVCDA